MIRIKRTYEPAMRADGRRLLVERLCRRGISEDLNSKPGSRQPILEASKHETVSLLHSARDRVQNGAVVLRDYLVKREAARPVASKTRDSGELRERPVP